ncbi:hypothetical protein EAH75_01330 [Rhodanobacter glycinis]|uniref:hypothetical protein n=1 Tax=Rhodanobacter glycinis TaxID=582702 RepID=UPI00112C8531|nr:hypothetical protein [Rhodanobacter glycinis]TPG50167.1 hypothetical protein EAH75_01330 [Rhodanobacter glycinis]
MAGDWIKMRIDLQSHPKVVRILSATHTDKFRVVGGLHAVWSVFDTHSEDGELRGYTPEALDHIIGWDGFARAMESVGWLLFDGLETLTLPEFTEHNGQSAKRRAEDQKRKKNTRNSVRILSADDEDKKQTREEKSREEKKEQKTTPKGVDLLPGISERIVADFLAIRKAKKQPLTETAVTGIKREAEKAGMSLEQALTESCERGWASFKAAWLTNGAHTPGTPTKKRKLLGEGSSTNYGDPA